MFGARYLLPEYIDCDEKQGNWVNIALKYLPSEIINKVELEFVFISLGKMDACRLPSNYRKKEIIFLSNKIFPLDCHKETDLTSKYFIFVVLHEIAHAICKHRSPRFNNLTKDEFRQQENEADNLAIEWFNNHASSNEMVGLTPLTKTELEESNRQSIELGESLSLHRINWVFSDKNNSTK